jgi:hypothetical protein
MTLLTLSNEKILGCAQKVHDANKSKIQFLILILLAKVIDFMHILRNKSADRFKVLDQWQVVGGVQ